MTAPSASAPTAVVLPRGSAARRSPSWRAAAGLAAGCVALSWLTMVTSLLFWTYAPLAVGWRPLVVLSGSMEPGLRPGDVVLTERVARPLTLPPGRVVHVDAPDLPAGSYVHRVVRHDPDGGLVTRGDANPSEDYPSVPPDRVLGQVRLVVPSVGLPVLWMRTGRPVPVLLFLLLTTAAGVLATRRGPTPGG